MLVVRYESGVERSVWLVSDCRFRDVRSEPQLASPVLASALRNALVKVALLKVWQGRMASSLPWMSRPSLLPQPNEGCKRSLAVC